MQKLNNKIAFLFIFTLFLIGVNCKAQTLNSDLAVAQPGYYNSGSVTGVSSSLLIRGMGGACIAMESFVDTIPCNPAFVPYESEPRLMGNMLVSNGYDQLDKVRSLLNNKQTLDSATTLLNGKQPLDIELQGRVTFFSNRINGMYEPVHSQLHSNMVGNINPAVQLFVYSGENLKIQWGLMATKNLSMGLQFNWTKSKVINRYFQFFELATDAGKNLLNYRSVQYLSLDPGLNYKLGNLNISYVLHELGSPQIPELNLRGPDHQFGLGYSLLNDINVGKIDFLLDYQKNTTHFGFKYEYGVLSVVGGLSDYGASAGIFFFIKKMFSGIVFSNTNLPWKKNEPINTVYTQFGLQI